MFVNSNRTILVRNTLGLNTVVFCACKSIKIFSVVFCLILFNLYSECLTKEALEGFGDLKIGRQIINTVKYADDFV
jgi:hypothetical protein